LLVVKNKVYKKIVIIMPIKTKNQDENKPENNPNEIPKL